MGFFWDWGGFENWETEIPNDFGQRNPPGMGIGDADFGALVEDLSAALDKFKVGSAEKNDLRGGLGPMKKDIVTK